MEVKDIQGNILIDALVTEQAVKVDELMKQHNITLSWVSVTDDELPLGAYIEHEGVKYSLLAPYNPEQSDEATYAYKPVFEHPVMRWKYVPFFFYTYSEGKVVSKELDWNLTDNPANFMKAVCDAILNETGEDWSYEISADLSASASQSFSNTDIFSALNAIAGAFETEWWFDYANKIVYLSKASFGSAVTLEVGQNIGVPSKNQSKDGYYTRFYAFGSTRNIEQNYAGSNVNSIVNKRLTLNPAKYPNGYIDIREGLTESEILVKTLVFDDIYPRSFLTIADVKVRLMWRLDSDKKKVQIGTDSNGNPVYDQYAIWYFKVPGLQFDKDSIISGKALSVHFNSGALNGREFELTYHDAEEDVETSDGTSIHVEKGDFEINFIEEGTFIIPAISGLVPNDGDEITLFNIKMPEEYKTSAYNDLEEAVLKEIAKQDVDNNNYTFESNKEAFYDSNPNLTVGRKVLYKNGNSVLETRVIKLETQLDYAFEQKITIGNEQIKGNTQTLKEEVVNANQNIDLISAINESTQQLVQSYQRTQKALLDSMAKWGDMWQLDKQNNAVRTTLNLIVEGGGAFGKGSGGGGDVPTTSDIIIKFEGDDDVYAPVNGVITLPAYPEGGGEGGGIDEAELEQYLKANQYAKKSDIPSLNGYATEQWVNQQGFLTQHQDLSAYAKSDDVANTYATKSALKGVSDSVSTLREDFDNLNDVLNGNVGGVIDTWNEVVAFLDGYSQSDDLAAILAGMNEDISNRVLTTDFEKANDSIKDLLSYFDANGNANNALKLGGHSADYFATATAVNTLTTNLNSLALRVSTNEQGIATNKTNIATLVGQVKGLADDVEILKGYWYIDNNGNLHTTHNIVVEGGGAFGKGSTSGGDVPSANVSIKFEGSDVLYNPINGVITLPAYPSAGGGVADSVAWTNVIGKPTTLGGYGITDALPLSGGTMSGLLTIKRDLAGVRFLNSNGESLGWLGFLANNTPVIYNSGGTESKYLVHSGNIDSYAVKYAGGASVDTARHSIGYDNSSQGSQNLPTAGGFISADQGAYGFQLLGAPWGTKLFFRGINNNSLSDWKTIAFTDSNVASATKLQTAQTIWGQSFDGTGNVSGGLADVTSILTNTANGIGIYRGSVYTGALTATDIAINGSKIVLNPTGNVLIGTTTDNSTEKLQVAGQVASYSSTVGAGFRAIGSSYTLFFGIGSGNVNRGIYDGTNAKWWIYRDATTNTYIPDGKVLIGTTTDSGYKLAVNGTLNATTIYQNGTAIGSLAFKNSLVASDIPNLDWSKITSGKPTTLGGYGITNGVSGYKTSEYLTFGFDNVRLVHYGTEGDWRLTNSGWTREYTLLHSNNYTSYTYPKTDIDTKLAGYLPLSGGTMVSGAGIYSPLDSVYAAIAFNSDHNAFGSPNVPTRIRSSSNPVYTNGSVEYSLIHSGNIGSQSVAGLIQQSVTDLNNVAKGTIFKSSYGPSNAPETVARYYNGICFAADNNDTYRCVLALSTNGLAYSRIESGGTWQKWKQIAYTDSNVASATKLATPRTIWGQSFDGSANVSGNLSLYNDAISWFNDSSNYSIQIKDDGQAYYKAYYGHHFYSLATERMRITSGGNVLIGTTTDSGYKLDVAGIVSIGTSSACIFNMSRTSLNYFTTPANGNFGFVTNGKATSMANSDLVIQPSFVIPGATNIVCLGSENYRWKVIYGQQINLSSHASIGGNLTVAGGGAFGSDIRYKDITSYRQLDLETIANAPLFTFKWNDREDKIEHLGTSAQYWLETQAKDAVNITNPKFFHLDYGALGVGIGISVGREVKVVKTEVKVVKSEVEQLRDKVKDLETRLSKYEQVWQH